MDEKTTQFSADDILWCREFGRVEGVALARKALLEAREFMVMFNGDVSKIDAALRECQD